MTKMAAKWLKSIPNLWPKRLKNHTLGVAHTYIAHIREYPPGTLQMDNKISEIKANSFVKATVAFFEQVSDEEHRGIAGL